MISDAGGAHYANIFSIEVWRQSLKCHQMTKIWLWLLCHLNYCESEEPSEKLAESSSCSWRDRSELGMANARVVGVPL